MAGKKVAIEMKVDKKCKSCVRYRAADDKAAVNNVYVSNEGLEEIGNPGKITVTIESSS